MVADGFIVGVGECIGVPETVGEEEAPVPMAPQAMCLWSIVLWQRQRRGPSVPAAQSRSWIPPTGIDISALRRSVTTFAETVAVTRRRPRGPPLSCDP